MHKRLAVLVYNALLVDHSDVVHIEIADHEMGHHYADHTDMAQYELVLSDVAHNEVVDYGVVLHNVDQTDIADHQMVPHDVVDQCMTAPHCLLDQLFEAH